MLGMVTRFLIRLELSELDRGSDHILDFLVLAGLVFDRTVGFTVFEVFLSWTTSLFLVWMN